MAKVVIDLKATTAGELRTLREHLGIDLWELGKEIERSTTWLSDKERGITEVTAEELRLAVEAITRIVRRREEALAERGKAQK
jgi:hypothetical protein